MDLPSTWEAEGHVHGLKAIGNFTVDQDWKGGELTKVKVTSHAGSPLYIKYPGIAKKVVRNAAGKKVSFNAKDANTIVIKKTKVGESYVIE